MDLLRDKAVAYGSIADNGTRMMRTCDEFGGARFANCLDRARRKYPEVALLIVDDAARHESEKARKYQEKNPEMGVPFLPSGGPERPRGEMRRGPPGPAGAPRRGRAPEAHPARRDRPIRRPG